jgi:hypothetical protein
VEFKPVGDEDQKVGAPTPLSGTDGLYTQSFAVDMMANIL